MRKAIKVKSSALGSLNLIDSRMICIILTGDIRCNLENLFTVVK